MSKLVWDQTGEKFFETGVEQCVLFPLASNGTYPNGYAWNGVSSIAQNPSGAEATPVWADNRKYLNLISDEEFGATLEAYTWPDQFAECDGSKEIYPGVYAGQQARKGFGLAYKTLIGNDIDGTSKGYKLHLVWNAMAAPSSKTYTSTNDSPEAMALSWELTTTKVESGVVGVKPLAHLEIDSTKTDADKLAALEEVVFGSESADSHLPSPKDVFDILKVATLTGITATKTKTTYTTEETFSTDDVTVTASYDDETTKDVTAEATIGTVDITTEGEKTLNISYKGKTTTITITVTAAE